MEYSSASPSKPSYNFLQQTLRTFLNFLGFETKTQQADQQIPANNSEENQHHDDDDDHKNVSISSRGLPKRSEITRGGGARIS
ncbi:hypothetical protein FNV43_RR10528 [Rhamnella rubrinervis]|uniref:Uncharacterized protein n=1 Tax=Rhamnella rubrinervis TaxID=2594499 RepID=A0A8K0H3Y2_9ROSA|nr:hypothetical protein FNV43_RR10528 [Rhamnella rubrinervis]